MKKNNSPVFSNEDNCLYQYSRDIGGMVLQDKLFVTKDKKFYWTESVISLFALYEKDYEKDNQVSRTSVSMEEAFDEISGAWVSSLLFKTDLCIPDLFLDTYLNLIRSGIDASNCNDGEFLKASTQIKDWVNTKMEKYVNDTPLIVPFFSNNELDLLFNKTLNHLQKGYKSKLFTIVTQPKCNDERIVDNNNNRYLFQLTQKDWYGEIITQYFLKDDNSVYKVSKFTYPDGTLMDVTVKEEGDLYFVLKSVARQLDCDVNNEVHASIINNVTVDILDEYLFVCYQILKEAIHAYNSDEIGLCLPESPMADADMINNDIDAQYYELNHYYSKIRQFVNKHLKKINNFYKKGLTPPFGYKLLAVFMDAIIYSSGNSKYPKIVREIIYK